MKAKQNKKKEKRKFVEICAACMQSQQKRYNEGQTMVLLWCLNRKLNTVSWIVSPLISYVFF